MRTCPLGSLAALVLIGAQAAAQGAPNPDETPADKTAFNLFNPTPDRLLRPLSADRPDATESPITVDAGRFQLEMSALSFTYDDEDGVRHRSLAVGDTNLKVGLLHNADLQFVFTAWSEEESDPGAGPSTTRSGFGDVQLRLKINLWGNDSGATALGVMPYITIPTGGELSSDRVEGGFIAMWAWDFAQDLSLGLQGEVAFLYDDTDDAYDTEFSHTGVLGIGVTEELGVYLEYLGVASGDDEEGYDAYFSGGLTLQVAPNVVFDVGALVGLTQDAEDVAAFTGITVRF